MTAEKKNLGLNDGNSGRSRQTPGCLCERAKRLGFGFVESGKVFEYQKPQNLGLKPHLPKNRPSVPVHFSGVPIHFGYCPFFRRVYRYTWRVYRYTLPTVHF